MTKTKQTHEQRLIAKRLLDEDWRIRYSLEIHYVGLHYEYFGAAPKELYQDKWGQKYIKDALAKYRKVRT